MKTKIIILLVLVSFFFQSSLSAFAQCTEEKDADMAKYKKLTETQDAQGCSQCAMLALYFCSATYSVKIEDKRKVSALITACKGNIRNMGQPYCCPELLNKEPQWGKNASNQSSSESSGRGVNTSTTNSSNNTFPGSGSQNSKLSGTDSSICDIIAQLLSSLQSNPDNPLNVDNKLLSAIATTLDQGSLQSKLLSYSSFLGTDSDLGMRQIYWDIQKALHSNTQLANSAQYDQLDQGLDILLDSPEQLARGIQAGIENYQPGIFLNDPYFMGQMYNLTGSQSTAEGLGMAAEIAGALAATAEEKDKFNEQYMTYAKMSSKTVYYEKDHRLATALIDACVGRNALTMITQIYRYDFDNGASLLPENGILKFLYPKKNIKIDLIPVENRNQGSSYYTTLEYGFGGKVPKIPQLIYPSWDDNYFFLNTGKIESNNNCTDCLERYESYVINTETGTSEKLKYKYLPDYDNVLDSYISGKTLTILNNWENKKLLFNSFPIPGLKVEYASTNLTSKKPYRYNDEIIRLDNVHDNKNLISQGHKVNYTFKKEEFLISLFWGKEKGRTSKKIMTSSYLSIDDLQSTKKNSDLMVNELTGLVKSKNGILYFVTSTGRIGKVDLESKKLNDPEFSAIMRASLQKQVLDKYDFSWDRKFVFRSTDYSDYYNLPILSLTPDDRYLIYLIGSKLYLIDVNQLDSPKKFNLTIEPHIVFYGKENGEATVYLQAFNEYKFPITKKYSLNKLIIASIDQ